MQRAGICGGSLVGRYRYSTDGEDRPLFTVRIQKLKGGGLVSKEEQVCKCPIRGCCISWVYRF